MGFERRSRARGAIVTVREGVFAASQPDAGQFGVQDVGGITEAAFKDNNAKVTVITKDGKLDLAGSNGYVQGGNSFGANAVLGTNDAFSLILEVNGVGEVTLLSGGGFIVGHTAKIVTVTSGNFQVLGTGAVDSGVVLGRWSADSSQATLEFVKSRNAVIGSNTIVLDNDSLGGLRWLPDDGIDFATTAAQFFAEVDDASPAAGDIGMAFVWQQMPGGGGVIAETMRLSASGNLDIVKGSFLVGGVQVLNTARQVVVDWIPDGDVTKSLGEGLRRWKEVHSPLIIGDDAASGTLTFRATSNATPGAIIFEVEPGVEAWRTLATGEPVFGRTTLVSAAHLGAFEKSQNASSILNFRNATDGTGAVVGIQLQAATSGAPEVQAAIFTTASSFTESIGYEADALNIIFDGGLGTAGGMNLLVRPDAPIRFKTDGNVDTTSSERAQINKTAFQPGADDRIGLGISGTAFADLFLASGAVINFNAGDVTLTHSSNLLTLAGGSFVVTSGSLRADGTSGTAVAFVEMDDGATVGVGAAGEVRMRSNAGTFEVSENGGAFATLGGGNTLDGAYDQGGAAAGRTINVDASSPVVLSGGGTPPTPNANTLLTIHDSTSTTTNAELSISAGTSGSAILNFGTSANEDVVYFELENSGTDTFKMFHLTEEIFAITAAEWTIAPNGGDVNFKMLTSAGNEIFKFDGGTGVTTLNGGGIASHDIIMEADLSSTMFFLDGGEERITMNGDNATLPALDTDVVFAIIKASAAGDDCEASIISGITGNAILNFGDTADEDEGFIDYDNNDDSMAFGVKASQRMELNAEGLTLGTSDAVDSGSSNVLALTNGTAPTAGVANAVNIYSSDESAGHTVPSFYCEGTNVLATGQGDSVSSVRVIVRINGTLVTLLAI